MDYKSGNGETSTASDEGLSFHNDAYCYPSRRVSQRKNTAVRRVLPRPLITHPPSSSPRRPPPPIALPTRVQVLSISLGPNDMLFEVRKHKNQSARLGE